MSDDLASSSLLPAGFRDGLPPHAEHETAITARLMDHFARQGYEQVAPPFVEFEDSFLAGAGAATSRQTFRLMDPMSQRMMALRSDLTPQVARIATTRLAGAPRPLRLSYAGTVLRVVAGQLRPERQFRQAGIELIGSDEHAADAEVILLAAHTLRAMGVRDLTVDLNLPPLVPAVCAAFGVTGARLEALKSALDRKDAALVSDLAGDAARPLLLALIGAGGPAETALARLAGLDLPPAAVAAVEEMAQVVPLVMAGADGITVTIDPVEHRGFEYHTGTSFSLFARGVRTELGRGGRYRAGACNGTEGETATGVTLYLDAVLRALPPAAQPRRLFVPAGVPVDELRRLGEQGWITVRGLTPVGDAVAEAARLRCSHALVDGTPVEAGRQRG